MKILKKLAHFFLPHKRNDHKPFIFHEASILVILSLVVVAEFFILSYAFFVTQSSYFLSAILPNVLVELTNSNRAEEKLPILRSNRALDRAAQAKADDMARSGYFAHTSPAGVDPWYWILKENYIFTRAGENLAVNFYGSSEVVDAWMRSPTHRQNILNGGFSEIGIGIAQGIYKGQGATFIVQMFATPAAHAFAAVSVAPKTSSEDAAMSPPSENKPEETELSIVVLGLREEVSSQTPLETMSLTGQIPMAQKTLIAALIASPRSALNAGLLFALGIVGLVLLACAAIELRRRHWGHILRGAFLFAVLCGVVVINTLNPFAATLVR